MSDPKPEEEGGEEVKKPETHIELQDLQDRIAHSSWLYLVRNDKSLSPSKEWDAAHAVTMYDQKGNAMACGNDHLLEDSKHFELQLLSDEGGRLMSMEFKRKFIGAYLRVYDATGTYEIGRIQRHNDLTNRRIVVLNAQKNVVYTLMAKKLSARFTIWDKTEVSGYRAGKISFRWKDEEVQEASVSKRIADDDVIALHLPAESTPLQRALLIASMFFINFLWPRNGPERFKSQ
mmetsp:Transcript_35157/g.88463  ORF Transcript_35157/g.88463 Transcript_35157/m.88463 type:complete len:233 (+) Transcript_35157:44-742(+)|eukprot:CAMPEP_0177648422 /NCGR_PEP_ID=MMETSP0447-20121125/10817_1 /TAXON_ID=0 /ORGANISM="Stygamoeba regulata, Strain BSH-02190019" /LENGTH=232 /DNA_ID=CAMNT_0019151057 /DNA_START=257 /DNA_END=955 /DNA_ORIENTATION=-